MNGKLSGEKRTADEKILKTEDKKQIFLELKRKAMGLMF